MASGQPKVYCWTKNWFWNIRNSFSGQMQVLKHWCRNQIDKSGWFMWQRTHLCPSWDWNPDRITIVKQRRFHFIVDWTQRSHHSRIQPSGLRWFKICVPSDGPVAMWSEEHPPAWLDIQNVVQAHQNNYLQSSLCHEVLAFFQRHPSWS